MEKAKIISKNQVEIIDYDSTLKRIEYERHLRNRLFGDEQRTKSIKNSFDAEIASLEEYKEIKLTTPEIERDIDAAIAYYEEEDDIIIQKWEIIHNDKFRVKEKINILKSELTAKDYINMKRFQGQIPDDQWSEFTLWAEGKRVEIRELEKLLETEDNTLV